MDCKPTASSTHFPYPTGDQLQKGDSVTLPFQTRGPIRVLLPGIVGTNRMRPSWVPKQRKALLFDQRTARCELSSQSTGSLDRLWAGLLCRSEGRGRGSGGKGARRRSGPVSQRRVQRPALRRRRHLESTILRQELRWEGPGLGLGTRQPASK